MPDSNASNRRKINNSLDMLRKQVDDLYTNTYYTRDSSEEMKTQVTDRLDDAIRRSTQGDDEFQNISNTSKLFRKLLKSDGASAPRSYPVDWEAVETMISLHCSRALTSWLLLWTLTPRLSGLPTWIMSSI